MRWCMGCFVGGGRLNWFDKEFVMVAEAKVSIERQARLPPPGVTWHYTTIDVLEHFLQGEVAFSHYKFLNDDSELSYGRQLLRDIFDGLENEGLKKFIEGEIVDKLVADAYLFCLSRAGDNLYQWRSYTPHGGIAVGFDRRQLYSAIHNGLMAQEWSSVLGKINVMLLTCRYRDDFAKRVVVRLNQKSNASHGACCDGCKGFGVVIEKFMKVLLSQKNPSFREEQEERFLLIGVPRDKDRPIVINGKPRIMVKDLGIFKSITCVRMSPHGDYACNRLLVEIIRDKYGLEFPIEKSESSFNGR